MTVRGHRYVIGTLPPPVGGVSTFVRRHAARLRSAGVQVEIRDWIRMSPLERLRWLLFLVARPGRITLEFNAYETWSMAAVLCRPFAAEITLRIHSGGPETRLSSMRKRILRRFLRVVDHFILVGPHVRGVMESAGFHIPPEAEIQPAFLPPPASDEEAILTSYGPEGAAFLDSHDPVLVIQGADAFRDGIDLYGSDLALDALTALRATYPQVGLVIGRPSTGDHIFQAYCKGLQDRMASEGLLDAVWILDGGRELWPVIKRSSVFLRPTTSDGDSISVREALYFGVEVVASDAAPRPEGVHLFANRDSVDFIRAILEALRSRGSGAAGTSSEFRPIGRTPNSEDACS